MANRHKMSCKADGGRVSYSGSNNVVKEAAAKKRGGALAFDGDKGKSIKKARGGGVGADKSPFSSAGGGGATKHPFSSAHRG